jgi:hypothetical protein
VSLRGTAHLLNSFEAFMERSHREAAWQILDRATAARKSLLSAGYKPIPTNGKCPFQDGWQNTNADEADIESWARQHPHALNTGILTATTPAADIDVLDPTTADELQDLLWSMIGNNGHALVRYGKRPKRAVLFQTAEPFDKVSTPVFISPNGDTHRVEVLCNGQQIIAHGTHPNTGMPYMWVGGEPGSVLRDDLPYLDAKMAQDFIAKATEVMRGRGWIVQGKQKSSDTRKSNSSAASDFDSLYGGHERKWAATALAELAAELAGMPPETGRNERLYRAAFRMGTMIARRWIERTAVEDCLLEACRANALERDTSAGAVRASLRSGLDGGEAVPHEDLRDTPASGDEAWCGVTSKPSGEQADPLANFIFMGDDKPAPQRMLIEGVMPLEGLPFIGGQSSAGKTFVAVLLAACAATGKPFFGREVKERIGSVIIAAEGKAMLNARVAAALSGLGVTERAPIAWAKQVPDFSSSKGLQALVGGLKAISAYFQKNFSARLGLVFVDTVSASFDIKEEADNAEAARVCKIMRRLGEAIGALVVPIHHYGKNAGVGLRGASAWRANADFVLSVMADIDPQTGDVSNRQLAVAKDRDGSQGPLTPFSLQWVELGIDDAGQPWGSMVAVAEISTAKPASDWTASLSVFRRALLNALIESGFEARPFADGPKMQVVDIERVKIEFFKACHVESDTEARRQEARRKQFTRKLTDAQQRALVGVQVTDNRTLIWLVASGADDAGRTFSIP